MGEMAFVMPSPNWKASTETWRVTPTTSPSGAMIGMVVAAWPEPEAKMKFNAVCTSSMPTAAMLEGRVWIMEARALMTESMISPSWRMTTIARASPMQMAAKTMSLAPMTKLSAISLGLSRPRNPQAMPMMRKIVMISCR